MFHLNEIVRDGRIAFGGWIQTDSPWMLDAYFDAGFSYVGIDLQHTVMGEKAVLDALSVRAGKPGVVLVRVAGHDVSQVGRVLDAGASGVIVPLVDTAEQAEAMVRAATFPPRGSRSYGPLRADLAHLSIEEMNRSGAVLAMIESAEGMKNAAEIAAVPGLAGIYVGPGDLAVSRGREPGEGFATEMHQSAFQEIARLTQARQIIFGTQALDPANAKVWAQWGANLITVGGERSLVTDAAHRLADELRQLQP